jgi:hypothetical protein
MVKGARFFNDKPWSYWTRTIRRAIDGLGDGFRKPLPGEIFPRKSTITSLVTDFDGNGNRLHADIVRRQVNYDTWYYVYVHIDKGLAHGITGNSVYLGKKFKRRNYSQSN